MHGLGVFLKVFLWRKKSVRITCKMREPGVWHVGENGWSTKGKQRLVIFMGSEIPTLTPRTRLEQLSAQL